MTRVIIESPLAAPTVGGKEKNKQYAKLAMIDSLLRGEAPFASHLLYDQPGLLIDESTEQRTLGMQAGFAWGKVAELCAVYIDHGVTDGMEKGIALAHGNGIPIAYRRLLS